MRKAFTDLAPRWQPQGLTITGTEHDNEDGYGWETPELAWVIDGASRPGVTNPKAVQEYFKRLGEALRRAYSQNQHQHLTCLLEAAIGVAREDGTATPTNLTHWRRRTSKDQTRS